MSLKSGFKSVNPTWILYLQIYSGSFRECRNLTFCWKMRCYFWIMEKAEIWRNSQSWLPTTTLPGYNYTFTSFKTGFIKCLMNMGKISMTMTIIPQNTQVPIMQFREKNHHFKTSLCHFLIWTDKTTLSHLTGVFWIVVHRSLAFPHNQSLKRYYYVLILTWIESCSLWWLDFRLNNLSPRGL